MTSTRRAGAILCVALAAGIGAGVAGRPAASQAPQPPARADGPTIQGWQKGKGWGWVWGKDDELGSLNAMTDATRAAALGSATRGETFDLGLAYSRRSFRWPGHNPGEILSFRSPEGIDRMADPDAPPREANPDRVYWHSCAMFISDNVATQIDGLGHITAGADNHWYNGFKESDWGGDFGIRKCDAASIPPIIARGVLIDVAAFKKVDALPGHTPITPKDLQDALAAQGTTLKPGDVVLIRTGTARYWGHDGANHAEIAAHDSAGITLDAAKWLVEDQGAMMIGSDTSGLEVNPPAPPAGTGIPVHRYLLVDQGVHIGEFHYLEDLSRAKAYIFCYVATTNKIKGSVAGTALRPIAIR